MDNKHTRIHEVVSNFFNILTKKNYLLEEDQIKIFKRKMINSGPLYVKICQLIAQRTDLFEINDLLKKELEELHDNVPPHEYSDTIKMVKSYDLENDIFFTNKNPIGVGAMAQVYLVEYENKKCVLKIKHPNIDKLVEANIKDFKIIVGLLSTFKYRFLKSIDMDYFYDTLKLQSDFSCEADALKTMSKLFENCNYINFPKVIKCTKDFILESYEEGNDVNSFLRKYPEKAIKTRIYLITSILQMIFANRFYHADCHNGNMLVNNNEDEVKITFLDLGLHSKLDTSDRDAIANLFKAAIQKSEKLFKKALINSLDKNISVKELEKHLDLGAIITSNTLSDRLLVIKSTLVQLRNKGIKIKPKIFNAIINLALIVDDSLENDKFTIFDIAMYNILYVDKSEYNEKLKSIFLKIIPEDHFKETENEIKLLLGIKEERIVTRETVNVASIN